MIRKACVAIHRWVGLGMAGFLILVGLTGSILAFNMELERMLAPQLFAPVRPGAERLDLGTIAERAERLVPTGKPSYITHTAPNQTRVSFEPRTDPATGRPYGLGFTELFVDPFTGAELGRRRSGDLSQGLVNVMPFVYDLHWRLALGDTGQWVLGITALAWTVDCFVAFYITLPQTARSFWRRWGLAWRVKRGVGPYRLNFDLHRAGGLWLWAMLFIFAWSSVMMDLRRPVYEWVMGSIFDFTSRIDALEKLPKHETPTPGLDWRAAEGTGRRLLAEQGAKLGFTIERPLSLSYVRASNVYSYEARASWDIVDRERWTDGTSVTFDGDTGALVELSRPRGEHLGNTVENWLYALHMGLVFGMPYRVLVAMLGLAVGMLSVTGIYIWAKKRRRGRA